VNSDVVGSSVQGEPVVYITAFVVLVLLAFARPLAESVVSLALLGGFAVAAVLFGGTTNIRLTENDKGRPGEEISRTSTDRLSTYVVGLLGFLTPPLLGLAGAYLVLAGQAWSVRWVVLVLLFVAYLKTRDMFTTVIVLLLGAGIGWVAVWGDPELQAGVAVALVWLLLLGAISVLVRTRRSDSGKTNSTSGSGESKKTSDLTPGPLGLALVWFVAILALWVGGRRLLGI
jgi:hypothetical protein